MRSHPMDTLALLKDPSGGVSDRITFEVRDKRTQMPTEALDRCIGSGRDFAVLFADAARNLGFGVRLASGSPDGEGRASDRTGQARPMAGLRSLCWVRAGSPLITRTAAWAMRT